MKAGKFPKRITRILSRGIAGMLAALMLLISPMTVLAANNGPSDMHDGSYYWAFIKLISPDDTVYAVFGNNTADNTAIAGATYDRASNTLTLKNFSHSDYVLSINMMGDDFKVKVEGDCELGRINVWGDGYGGCMNLTGTGSLTVNKTKQYESGIDFEAEGTDARFRIDSGVSLAAYGSVYAVIATNSTNPNGSEFITAGSESAGPVITEPEYYGGEYKTIEGISADELEWKCYRLDSVSDPQGIYAASYTCKFVEDDNYDYDPDEGKRGYWGDFVTITKYVYLEELGAYVEDPSFLPMDFTETEFEESEYTYTAGEGQHKKEIEFYGEGLEPGENYIGYVINNPGDMSNTYIYYTGSDEIEAGEYDGYSWGRLIYNSELGRYEEDETFTPEPLTTNDFIENGFSYVMENNRVEFTASEAVTEEYMIGKNVTGNTYAVSLEEDVYDYSESSTVVYGGRTYYIVTPNTTVNINDLEPVIEEGAGSAVYYHHYLNKKEFTVNGGGTPAKTDISKFKAVIASSVTYTGKARTPAVTVTGTVDGKSVTLKKETDFTVSYSNNVNPGTAKATITGKGNYKGNINKTFVVCFKDVPLTHSFQSHVYWACDNGIAAGYSGDKAGLFGINDDITRGQVVMFLWRAAGKPEPKSSKQTFKDVPTSHGFYKAIQWAVEEGITGGYTGSKKGYFGPNDNCTRGQIATFLWRYEGNPAPLKNTQTFKDVPVNHSFYKAIQWASEQKITAGYKDGRFGVKDTCTRGQCVTFLHRQLG